MVSVYCIILTCFINVNLFYYYMLLTNTIVLFFTYTNRVGDFNTPPPTPRDFAPTYLALELH